MARSGHMGRSRDTLSSTIKTCSRIESSGTDSQVVAGQGTGSDAQGQFAPTTTSCQRSPRRSSRTLVEVLDGTPLRVMSLACLRLRTRGAQEAPPRSRVLSGAEDDQITPRAYSSSKSRDSTSPSRGESTEPAKLGHSERGRARRHRRWPGARASCGHRGASRAEAGTAIHRRTRFQS